LPEDELARVREYDAAKNQRLRARKWLDRLEQAGADSPALGEAKGRLARAERRVENAKAANWTPDRQAQRVADEAVA
jgi:hypothetical protein